MIKRILLFVVLVALGLIVITHVILPQVSDTLSIPGLATWTGLEGFLKMLPFILVIGLLIGGIYSLIHRGQDDG